MKTKKQPNELIRAIKEDRNGMLGSMVISRKRTLRNPLKLKWNQIETIIWTPKYGISVLGKKDRNTAFVSRFVDKYPPKVWKNIIILTPVKEKRYTNKELIRLHQNLEIYHKAFDNMSQYYLAYFLSRFAKINTDQIFPEVRPISLLKMNIFLKNNNLKAISLVMEKK